MDQKRIDLRLGEARNIRHITCELFDLECANLNFDPTDWDYHHLGYRPLVEMLEDQYNAPVVITNGALQGLHAAIYALKCWGCKNTACRIPYWSRLAEIVKHGGLEFKPFIGQILPDDEGLRFDSLLSVIPNNPDGYLPSWERVRATSHVLKNSGVPFIHDAAYYTRTYLPIDAPIEAVGDLQIFSASKTYGLSGLRVGYIVVHNIEFYQPLLDFVESQTVGTSVLAQKMLLHILKKEYKLPIIREIFEKRSREAIKRAKKILNEVNPELVSFPEGFDKSSCGVFGWVKPMVNNLFNKIGVDVLDGELFGAPGFARINLGAGDALLIEAVKRINNVSKLPYN